MTIGLNTTKELVQILQYIHIYILLKICNVKDIFNIM